MRYLIQFSFMLLFTIQAAFAQAEYGMASIYSDQYQGSKTASGETYDMSLLTAAHKTLPFGTVVRVTRLDNRESVAVRINDRGPFVKGRIIDLSKNAAKRINLTDIGTVKVKVEVIRSDEEPATIAEPTKEIPKPVNTKPVVKPAPKNTGKVVKPKPAPSTSVPTVINTNNDDPQYGLFKIQVLQIKEEGYGVQIGRYTEYDNVLRQIGMLQNNWFKNILIHIEPAPDDVTVYKVILGPIQDLQSAQAYKKSLKKKGLDGFVVPLGDEK